MQLRENYKKLQAKGTKKKSMRHRKQAAKANILAKRAYD